MKNGPTPRPSDDRAVSEVLGVILLVGMVMTGALLVALGAGSALSGFQENIGGEATENTIEEIDTRLSSLASVGGFTRAEFTLGGADPYRFSVVKRGYIDVSVNKNASCTARIPLSSVRYEDEDGRVVAYEAGGIWRQPANGSAAVMHSPPDLTYDGDTLSMTVVNLSGRIQDNDNLAYINVSKSQAEEDRIREVLFNGTCRRPNNVTISVRSDYYNAWDRYLDGEINATSHNAYASNETVVVYLDQDKLPQETDDSRNDVVDLTSDEFNKINVTNTSIEVSKDANNTYTTIVTPLASGPQVAEIREVDDDQAFRPPLDVVFVLDESGSMGNDPDGDGDTKMREAKDAARTFVSLLNSSFDRSGAVGFDSDARYLQNSEGEDVYLSSNFSDVNESIETLSAGGGTRSDYGLEKGIAIHGLKSNSSRDKVIILLSDGEDDTGADPESQAEIADKDGIIIHSIGFGDPDNETLESIAETTGGTYHYVDDSDDLEDVFKELFAQISQSKQIVRDPLSMDLSTGSTTFYPQIDGDTSHIANDSQYLNLNDPLAPSTFSFSVDISDGDNVTLRSYRYGCDDWERTDETHVNQSTGKEYVVIRCADINESDKTVIDPKNQTVYLDGDNASELVNEQADFWQEDLQNETLAPYLEADNETLKLKSNQALVSFTYGDGDDTYDRLLVLYEIGQSTSDAKPSYIFNIQVRYLTIVEK